MASLTSVGTVAGPSGPMAKSVGQLPASAGTLGDAMCDGVPFA
jgi:hypothetical protein